MNKVSESLARPLRTATQGGPALAIAEIIDSFIYDMTDRQYGALVTGLVILFSYIQIVIENYKGRALFRNSGVESVPRVG